MKFALYPAGLGVCLALLALSAGAQTTTGDAPHAVAAPGTTANTGTAAGSAGGAPTAPASNSHKHHTTAHHQAQGKQKPMAEESPGSVQDTAYGNALRHCVEGQAGQRDSCLDNAIARFGRA